MQKERHAAFARRHRGRVILDATGLGGYEVLPSGTITYAAPSGYHDDCVMALALANDGRWEAEGCGRMLPFAADGWPAAGVVGGAAGA